MGKGTSATYNPANSCPVLAKMSGADGHVPPGMEFVLGKDDYGCDVKYYGATSGVYILWDETNDRLDLVNAKARIGTGQGSSGVALTGTDPDQLLQVHAKMTTAVAAGAYAAGYFTNTVSLTQSNNVSIFGVWSELYVTGGTISLISNHAAVWGNLEISGTVTLPGGVAWHGGLVGTVISPATLTVSSGGILAGVVANSEMTASYTATGAYVAGFAVHAGTSKPWAMGLYIPAAAVDKAIVIGALSSSTVGSGVSLTDSVTRVVEVHADDNNTARTAGVQGRAILGRTMIYANTSQENWGIDGLLKWSGVVKSANVDAGVVGRFEAIGTCQTSTGSGNTFCAGVMGRIGSATTGFTIDSGTWVVGVLGFYNTSTTNAFGTGSTAAFMATASDLAGTGDWDYGLYIEDCVNGVTIAACTGHLISAATTSTWGTGITGGAIAIGDYSNAVAFGTVSEHIIGQVINISAAVDDDSNIIPLHVAFTNTADCGASSVGQVIYARSTLAYAITDCYSVRARLDLTDATTPSVNQLFGVYSTVTTKACELAATGMIAGLATLIEGTADVTQAGTYAKVCGLYVAWKEETAMTVDTVGVYVANFTGAALDAGFRVNSVGDTVSAFRSEMGGGTVTNGLELVAAHTNAFALPASGTAPVSTGGTVGTHGTATLKIAMTIGGSTYYLLASTVPTFT